MINEYNIVNGAKYFSLRGSQNYFVCQPVFKSFKPVTNNIVSAWKSKRFSDESIKSPIQDKMILIILNFE